jgi:uncharacterized protein (TIGR03067 family)
MTFSSTRRTSLAASLIGLIAPLSLLHAQPNGDNSLRGVWRLEAFEVNGVRIASSDAAVKDSDLWNSRFRFDALKAEWLETPDSKPHAAPLKLDAAASPKAVELEIFGVKVNGIYEVRGDILKACFSVKSVGRGFAPGREPRPVDFTTKGTLERLVLIFAKTPAAKTE